MSEALSTVSKPAGWWKVTDRVGEVAYYEFREDGRARMVRGRFWDWCGVQGTWEAMTDPCWLEWANAVPKPVAVYGEPGFLAHFRKGQDY